MQFHTVSGSIKEQDFSSSSRLSQLRRTLEIWRGLSALSEELGSKVRQGQCIEIEATRQTDQTSWERVSHRPKDKSEVAFSTERCLAITTDGIVMVKYEFDLSRQAGQRTHIKLETSRTIKQPNLFTCITLAKQFDLEMLRNAALLSLPGAA